METQSIVVLDFGSQYSQLIARRIRELNVFSAVLPCNASLDEIRSYSPVGIILSGGPSSVYDKDAPVTDPGIFDLGLPILGICYGLQYMVFALGGKVRPADKREYGHAEVTIEACGSRLFEGLPQTLSVWMSHGDEAEQLPAGFRLTAQSPNAVIDVQHYGFNIQLNDKNDTIKGQAEISLSYLKDAGSFQINLIKQKGDGKGMALRARVARFDPQMRPEAQATRHETVTPRR